jgi:hypothetical protein
MLGWFHNSLTILWARIKMLVGAALGRVIYYADYLNITAVKDQVVTYLTPSTCPST